MEFFADQLMSAMKGMGTDEDHLVRVIVSRSEVKLEYKNTQHHFFTTKHKVLGTDTNLCSHNRI